MAVKGQQVALSAGVPAPLNALDTDDTPGQSFAITKPLAADIYVGDSSVTTSGATAGALVPAGSTLAVDLQARELVYAVCASSTTVHVLHTGG